MDQATKAYQEALGEYSALARKYDADEISFTEITEAYQNLFELWLNIPEA
jgi:hypothetical protein